MLGNLSQDVGKFIPGCWEVYPRMLVSLSQTSGNCTRICFPGRWEVYPGALGTLPKCVTPIPKARLGKGARIDEAIAKLENNATCLRDGGVPATECRRHDPPGSLRSGSQARDYSTASLSGAAQEPVRIDSNNDQTRFRSISRSLFKEDFARLQKTLKHVEMAMGSLEASSQLLFLRSFCSDAGLCEWNRFREAAAQELARSVVQASASAGPVASCSGSTGDV